MRHRRSLPLIAAVLVGATLAIAPVAAIAQGSPVPSPIASGGAAAMRHATPDGAVAAYVAGIAAGDVDAILDATVVDQMAAGFDFQASAERFNAMLLTTVLGPAQYSMFAEMNRYQQAAWILGQVRNLVYQLLSGETIDGSVIAPADSERIAAFVAAVDPSRLADLTLLDSRLPDPERTTSERYRDLVAKQAATYGADELTERLALIELDGTTYGLGLTLMRYGEDWGVSNQLSAMGQTSSLGTAIPMSRAEYDAATGG